MTFTGKVVLPQGVVAQLSLNGDNIVSRKRLCAMDKKVRSKPMQRILHHLLQDDRFEAVYFGDDTLQTKSVYEWPRCELLIAFYSPGFPLAKAIEYVKLRQPFCVNDLNLQQFLRDRRLVLMLLDACSIPTPKRLVVNRDGGPQVKDERLKERLKRRYGLDVDAINASAATQVIRIDDDTIEIGGERMRMPFVEKPADADDHRVRIYYASHQGGGIRQLFRKVENRSSEYIPGKVEVRTDSSYVYEEFINVDNAEDIKVYTVGTSFAHAETRKSPVVDGEVTRNSLGKEVRSVTTLSAEEQDMARKICRAFGQTICGFDLLRCDGQSLVMDVNGWSFVKGDEYYTERCANILRSMFISAVHHRRYSLSLPEEDCNLGNM